jgi:hypothetical protein
MNSRSGFHRHRNAVRFQTAKKRVAQYRSSITATSTSTTPKDIAGLEDTLLKHADSANKADSVVKTYETFPFLLHTNWSHDSWSHSTITTARDINYLRVHRGGAPVWAAAEALLSTDERASRTLHHVTCAIRRACMGWVNVGTNEVNGMKKYLHMLIRKHHEKLPVPTNVSKLAEVDMVGLYLAVVAKVWTSAEATAPDRVDACTAFEVALPQHAIDVEEQADVETRATTSNPKKCIESTVGTKAKNTKPATRKRTTTARYVNEASAVGGRKK